MDKVQLTTQIRKELYKSMLEGIYHQDTIFGFTGGMFLDTWLGITDFQIATHPSIFKNDIDLYVSMDWENEDVFSVFNNVLHSIIRAGDVVKVIKYYHADKRPLQSIIFLWLSMLSDLEIGVIPLEDAEYYDVVDCEVLQIITERDINVDLLIYPTGDDLKGIKKFPCDVTRQFIGLYKEQIQHVSGDIMSTPTHVVVTNRLVKNHDYVKKLARKTDLIGGALIVDYVSPSTKTILHAARI